MVGESCESAGGMDGRGGSAIFNRIVIQLFFETLSPEPLDRFATHRFPTPTHGCAPNAACPAHKKSVARQRGMGSSVVNDDVSSDVIQCALPGNGFVFPNRCSWKFIDDVR